MAIIELKHLTKEYQLGQLGSIKDTLLNLLGRVSGKSSASRESFKALDDINLTIEEGEIVGIIGQNGAGKSTLLKHLAGITNPTSGSIHVGGSVAPLIEVGAGLHPELTGRENVFLNGSILGIKKDIIREKIDDIVTFAELEDFIDTPIKRYSSGMRVRLGFAIATSFEADILIIDEVLAVGDLAFQRKCFSRLENLIKRSNRTVLLVSHNIRQVSRLCSRTILLDSGKVIADGNPTEICNLFYERSNKRVANYASASAATQNIRKTDEIDLLTIDILDENSNPTDTIPSNGRLHIRLKLELHEDLERPEINIGTHTTDFLYLTNSSTSVYDDRPSLAAGIHQVDLIIPRYPMVMGVYSIRVAIVDSHGRGLFTGETLKIFSVAPLENEAQNELPKFRLVNVEQEWVIENTVLKSPGGHVDPTPEVPSDIASGYQTRTEN